MTEPADQTEGLWITSDPHDDGTYRAVLSFDGDRSWPLSPFGARQHAFAALHAAAVADYEQAVYHQMTDGFGLGQDLALAMISALRSERGPVDDKTSPLQFGPGLNEHGKGFVHLTLDGRLVGQLDSTALRRHATGVLEMVAVLRLDAAYRRLLVEDVDLSDEHAKAAVSALADHRPEASP